MKTIEKIKTGKSYYARIGEEIQLRVSNHSKKTEEEFKNDSSADIAKDFVLGVNTTEETLADDIFMFLSECWDNKKLISQIDGLDLYYFDEIMKDFGGIFFER